MEDREIFASLESPLVRFTPPNTICLRASVFQESNNHIHILLKTGIQSKKVILKDGLALDLKIQRYRCKFCNKNISTPTDHFLYRNSNISVEFMEQIKALYFTITSLRRLKEELNRRFGVSVSVQKLQRLLKDQISLLNPQGKRLRAVRNSCIEETKQIETLDELSIDSDAWKLLKMPDQPSLLEWDRLERDSMFVFYVPKWRVFRYYSPGESLYHRTYIQVELVWSTAALKPGIYYLQLTRDLDPQDRINDFFLLKYNGIWFRKIYIYLDNREGFGGPRDYPVEFGNLLITRLGNGFIVRSVPYYDFSFLRWEDIFSSDWFHTIYKLRFRMWFESIGAMETSVKSKLMHARYLRISDFFDYVSEYFSFFGFQGRMEGNRCVFFTEHPRFQIRIAISALVRRCATVEIELNIRDRAGNRRESHVRENVPIIELFGVIRGVVRKML